MNGVFAERDGFVVSRASIREVPLSNYLLRGQSAVKTSVEQLLDLRF